MTYKKISNLPFISVIITSKNSEKTIEDCLRSIKKQNYYNYEMIVIDNKSNDNTIPIAEKYTHNIFIYGPERSAQRNFGAKKSLGDYLLFIDSDMKLSSGVIKNCASLIAKSADVVAIIIPEESFGIGFWAKCKKLERSYYTNIDWIEAARFYKKSAFEKAGGYDQNLISGEDWDLSQRVKSLGSVKRIYEIIFHNEGNISLINTIKKKFYYAQKLHPYLSKQQNKKYFESQRSIIQRYKLFLSNPKKLFQNPILGLGMLFMKTCEFGFGALGYMLGRIKT